MTEFNLRHLVREVAEESGAADPADLADAVFKKVPAKERPAALREALHHFVRMTVSFDRSMPPAAEERTGSGKPGTRSWKRDGVRRGWRAHLRQRLHVEDGWKFLGDCGFDDLMFAAAERREIASRTMAAADRYEALAKLLANHNVTRVADLPDEVLDEIETDDEGEAA